MKKLVVCLLAVTMVLCMSFAVVAVSATDSDFAPSIEVKPVPDIAVNEGIGAVINNPNDTTEDVLVKDMFYISYNQAKEKVAAGVEGDEADACNALITAYDALKEDGVEKSIENIDKFATEDLKIANPEYFVSHVFELNLGDIHDGKLEGDGSVTIKFDNADINAKAGKLVVTHMVDGKWVIVPKDNVKVTEETVEVTFDDLCPVAFLHVEEGKVTPTPTPTPTPGDDAEDQGLLTATIIILSITAVIILGIIVFYVLEKKGIIGNTPQNKSKKK